MRQKIELHETTGFAYNFGKRIPRFFEWESVGSAGLDPEKIHRK